MNSIHLIGRLTHSPDLNKTSSDKCYCRFSMAVQRRGDRDAADFFNCVAFGKTAELISQYVSKGQRIGVSGWVEVSTYTGRDGVKKQGTTVHVDSFDFIEPRGGGAKDSSDQSDSGLSDVIDDDAGGGGNDDDLPF